MNRTNGPMLRFIDLGLLILLSFLSVAELNPTLQVPLPDHTGNKQDAVVAVIEFDVHWLTTITRLDTQEVLCQPTTIEQIRSCIQPQSLIRFLIAPDANATVQQMVVVLDVCHQTGQLCSIQTMQP